MTTGAVPAGRTDSIWFGKAARVALVNLGCRVNRVELDSIANELEAAGHVLAVEADADVIVINTCAVTGEAEAKTRKAIRHAASRPKAPLVVATGCVASLFSDEFSALAENVEVVANKREVADYVIGRFEVVMPAAPAAAGADGSACVSVTPTGRTRPGIQVQDGCNNRCAYCIIWKARVCEQARELLPGVALGTDLIVGFPGETDEQFEESLAFCERMRFAKMHIFRYSRRPGTPAAGWDCQVDPKVMAERSRRAHKLAARMRKEEASRLVGCDDLVLVQYPGRAVSGGLFEVEVDAAVPLDTLLSVRFTDMRDDGTLVATAL